MTVINTCVLISSKSFRTAESCTATKLATALKPLARSCGRPWNCTDAIFCKLRYHFLCRPVDASPVIRRTSLDDGVIFTDIAFDNTFVLLQRGSKQFTLGAI